MEKLKDYAKVGGQHPKIDNIKNEVAKENGFKSWTDLFLDSLNGGSRLTIMNCWQEVALRCLNEQP